MIKVDFSVDCENQNVSVGQNAKMLPFYTHTQKHALYTCAHVCTHKNTHVHTHAHTHTHIYTKTLFYYILMFLF
jgi:hypothetical protein